jgi:hypothetical protein
MEGNTEIPLRRKQAAQFLTDQGFKTAPSYLDKLAVTGGGPEFFYWGRFPMYWPAKLLEYARSRCSGPRRSTSDPGAPAAACGEVPRRK